jgi:FlaA1/EpsC-like NDP-sugar epimerase
MRVAEAAISANVEIFVLISTDKAVRPTSVMGASKRVAELVLQAFAEQPNNTCFTMVRFGNVLDSSGSVIPLFKKQIKDGGPITVTHPNVIRYFMTIPEAVELVIQAGAMARGGEVFVLDMGEPIRIHDLAEKMIKLSGLQVLDENNPDGDIEIQYTGLRPGEKLYEELLVDGNFTRTDNELIMCAEEEMISWDKLEPVLTEIREAAFNSDTEKLYKVLSQLVPEYNPIYSDIENLKYKGKRKKYKIVK